MVSATASKRGQNCKGAGHSLDHALQMKEGLEIAQRGGSGKREGSGGLERLGQVRGGAGGSGMNDTAGFLPRAGGALEASCHRCHREASAHPQRAEGSGEAACPGPAGDKTA